MESSTKLNGPVKVFRVNAVSASVFANQTKDGETFYKVALQRTYKTDDGYKTSDSFRWDEEIRLFSSLADGRSLLDEVLRRGNGKVVEVTRLRSGPRSSRLMSCAHFLD